LTAELIRRGAQSATTVELYGVHKQYWSLKVLDDVSFR
jgi:hypothetical protein